jgi:two-component system phosphate regulon sensor histidine kinase PhoR
MARRKLIWNLFPSYLFVIVASIIAVVAVSTTSLRAFYIEQATLDLTSRAALIQVQIAPLLESRKESELQSLCEQLGRDSETRITVVLPSGDVLADSEEQPDTMDNHADRPEIQNAMNGGSGFSIRYSDTLKQQMMYVAKPISRSNPPDGVLRVALPITAIDDALWKILMRILLGSIIVALLAALASWIVSDRITRPLNEIRQAAEKFSRGEFEEQLATDHSQEIDALAESMSAMARQLDERVDTALRQKNEQEAVFSSMVESVLAVDVNGHLISINQTAAQLFSVDLETAIGRNVNELIRNTAFHSFLETTLKSNDPTEDEITFHLDEERVYQAHGTALRGPTNQNIGAVIVLDDITRLRRLERVRSDFVSNVSHELRTPVTSIKGFVETLLENPPNDMQDTKRFLEIISNNATQLHTLINDLLSLSRMEQGEIPADELLETTSLNEILGHVRNTCAHLLEQTGVRLNIQCPDGAQARVHPSLLQQAIFNLVENAIKFSTSNQEVLVDVEITEFCLNITVKDSGPGIGQEHLPRLFERFYRVDKARSREQGGTGLGLAIVKHIAELHGGNVSVESVLGTGSTFHISIPQR